MYFLQWKCLNSDTNSLKFVPKGPINNIPALVQKMAWRRPGNKPLSEPMMVNLLMHICVTRPQWVNVIFSSLGSLSQTPSISLRRYGGNTVCAVQSVTTRHIHISHARGTYFDIKRSTMARYYANPGWREVRLRNHKIDPVPQTYWRTMALSIVSTQLNSKILYCQIPANHIVDK